MANIRYNLFIVHHGPISYPKCNAKSLNYPWMRPGHAHGKKWSGQFGHYSTELYLIKGRVQQLFERPLGIFPIKNICIILGHNKYEYHFFCCTM